MLPNHVAKPSCQALLITPKSKCQTLLDIAVQTCTAVHVHASPRHHATTGPPPTNSTSSPHHHRRLATTVRRLLLDFATPPKLPVHSSKSTPPKPSSTHRLRPPEHLAPPPSAPPRPNAAPRQTSANSIACGSPTSPPNVRTHSAIKILNRTR